LLSNHAISLSFVDNGLTAYSAYIIVLEGVVDVSQYLVSAKGCCLLFLLNTKIQLLFTPKAIQFWYFVTDVCLTELQDSNVAQEI
jgi:hypothetical protein